MKRSEAENIIYSAAQDWLDELVEYILPTVVDAGYDGESARGYQARIAEIGEALMVIGGSRAADIE